MANQLELRQMEYFLALAECLHYKVAAEQVFISQSALSQQIQRLETILGEQLFERHNRKVALTTAGVLFREEAIIVVNQMKRSMERWRFRVDGGEGILKIGFVASAMQTFLPKVIKRFSKRHPKVKFYLEGLTNTVQLKALEQKQIDIGFVRSRQGGPAMNRLSVFEENLTLVLPKDHPVSAKNFENFGQFENESFILFPNEQSQMYYQQILNLCNEHGFNPQIKHRSIHGPTIFKLVESGLGISVIPNSLKDIHNYKVKFIELKKIRQKTELSAVWNKVNDNVALNDFLEVLKPMVD